MLIRWLACATDVCENTLGPPLMYQDLSTRHDWHFEKANVNLPIKTKGNLKPTSGNSLSPLGGQNKDIGAASQTLLTEIMLRLCRRLYGGAIPVLAAFVFARVHPQGLEGSAMAIV